MAWRENPANIHWMISWEKTMNGGQPNHDNYQQKPAIRRYETPKQKPSTDGS